MVDLRADRRGGIGSHGWSFHKMFVRFLLVGSLGFLVDAGLTQFLIGHGVSALLARPPGIAAAMAFTWLAYRSFTFKARQKRTFAEIVRYVAVASAAAVFNYGVYSALVLFGVVPLIAIVVATVLQSAASFFAYRKFVFGK